MKNYELEIKPSFKSQNWLKLVGEKLINYNDLYRNKYSNAKNLSFQRVFWLLIEKKH